MDLWYVAAALLSAVLHAGWNAAVKARPKPSEAMTAQMVLSALIGLPGLLWTGLPAQGSWIWIGSSTAMNLVTVIALLRAYDLVGFGTAYPVVRALSVLLVVPLAAAVSGEQLSFFGLIGVALVVVSLLLLAIGSSHGAVPRAALLWIAIAGLSAAAYVMSDAQGVRRAGSPIAYGLVVGFTNALAMSIWRGAVAQPIRMVREHALAALPIAVASTVSYLLILWVFRHAPIAPAAALRDTSSIFAVVIAVIWLKEPFTPLRLFAILLSAAAVPLLRLS
ncbi:MAG TPA: EamA family transporter [Reyranella sp.]|nr:EamA family transporter [Reyranella sp.]